ncbi:FAD-dependent oxidoreductase [Limnoraphis robusta]|uniref:FAD-dependent oxidoreductase n=1 Tax=Limnoraphis robusta CCNP1315 TaxID=3110306 RepID=A0ABU5U0I8_9CYAN|nr:FAD-dependent oxidoreductase [Limnoraphis robusta]MEA5496428.1 FAD-dependent oxidoreductase [Limnoraphis robusta BA-68 BA1]MEA5520437.1 FAD-dependent oxidoreductase [Limnoraphis robusta CCNP1315]MEA5546956.1 FAD-dependent oxidoreductase [Limnoraphis robusta CCNP1324]
MSLTEEILTQIPGNPLNGLRNADNLWNSLKNNQLPIPQTVKRNSEPLGTIDYDLAICGGTLGILIGASLASRGWRVALIERGILKGREQEWNISRQELDVFLELNLLSPDELNQAISTEYNPARLSFPNSPDIWVKDVLNIGVDPVYLLETLKIRFLEAGGKLFENTVYEAATVHPNGVKITAKQDESKLNINTRLLLDAMGHFSPIVRQARQGEKPDAVCLVVGTCATGYSNNETGDIFASFTALENQCQYFWEAFPAKDGRTTYLFTYIDAHPERFSLEFFFEEYLRLLPEYQHIELHQLTFKRALFGFFPCYKNSPLKTPWDRILPVGDSSASQSPLSFGGFGSMVRHLKRLTVGIEEALKTECLDQNALTLLQPYQPSLSVTWLFQRSMSVGVHQTINPDTINNLLAAVFQEMEQLGDGVLKPFLQDVVQFFPLAKTLFKTSISHPDIVFKVIPQVGLTPLLEWTVHYFNLGAYTALFSLGKNREPSIKNLSPIQQYYYHRWLEAWKYGSGQDYH